MIPTLIANHAFCSSQNNTQKKILKIQVVATTDLTVITKYYCTSAVVSYNERVWGMWPRSQRVIHNPVPDPVPHHLSISYNLLNHAKEGLQYQY